MKKRVTYTSYKELQDFLSGKKELLATGAPRIPDFIDEMSPLKVYIGTEVLRRVLEDNLANIQENMDKGYLKMDEDTRAFRNDLDMMLRWVIDQEKQKQEHIYIGFVPLDPNQVEVEDPKTDF